MSNTHRKSINAMVPVISEVTSAGGSVRLDVKGNSMWPLLRSEKDSVLLVKPDNIKKNDVILFRRFDGKIALHRVISLTDDHLTTIGDNQYVFEGNVDKSSVIAKAIEFRRGKKRLDEKYIRNFGVIWVAIFPLRRVTRKGLSWIRRHSPACIRTYIDKFR